MSIIRPSSSYELSLPDEITEDRDDRTVSFWIEGESLLLQLSSYIRNEGAQILASQRLGDRIAETPVHWEAAPYELFADLPFDHAAAFYQEKGTTWLHVYFVWPHLAIYATVSGDQGVLDITNWANAALRQIQVRMH